MSNRPHLHPAGGDAPKPGEKVPVSLSVIGAPDDGPWALVDGDGGITIALGQGLKTRQAVLILLQLAALAVRSLPPESVQQAMKVARDQLAQALTANPEVQEFLRRQQAQG